MTKRLHNKISRKAKTGKLFELVSGHGACRVLRSDRRHLWLAVLSRPNTRYPASFSYHFLGKGIPALGGSSILGLSKYIRRAEP